MGFSSQEYWSGLLCSPPGEFPNQGIEPGFPALQADSLPDSQMATHSSILAWKIPWTEERGGLQSMGCKRHDF